VSLIFVDGSQGFVEFVNTLATHKVMREIQRELIGASGSCGSAIKSKRLLRRLKSWHWTEEDVQEWMLAKGFSSAASKVHSMGVDGPTLLTLSDMELRQDFEIASVGDRKALLSSINSLYTQFIESQVEGCCGE